MFPSLCCRYLICQSCQFSFTILKFIGLWFLLYCNSKLHTKVASPFLSYCAILSSAKNGKLDDVVISLRNSKTLCLADRYWKMLEFQFHSRSLNYLFQ